jgi:putative molybdopterin biosynthesis protein
MWLNVRQVAERLEVTERTVYRLVKSGQLRAYRIGRLLKIHPEDFDDYLGAAVEPPDDKHEGPEPARLRSHDVRDDRGGR